MSSFIAASLFYLLPLFVGRGIYSYFKGTKKTHLRYPWILFFAGGALALYASALVTNYVLVPLLSVPFHTLFSAVCVALFVVSLIGNLFVRSMERNTELVIPVGISFLVAGIGYALWYFNSPYPFNWDVYEHQTLVNTILQGRFSFFTTSVTDTFNFGGYSTLYHTLLTVSQQWFSIDMYTYWHSISFLHAGFVACASYLLAYEVTHSKAVGYISIALAIFLFDATVTFTSLFFLPQTFTAVMCIFLMTQLIAQAKTGHIPKIRNIVIPVTFLLLSHYVIGSVAVAVYGTVYLYIRYHDVFVHKINRKLLVEIVLFIAVLAVLFSANLSLGFLNNGEGEAYTYNMEQKFTIMRQSYGFILLFFVIGAIFALRKKYEVTRLFLFITAGLLALILMQLPYVLKFFVIARYFVYLFMALGVYWFILLMRYRVLKVIGYTLFIGTLVLIFIANGLNWKQYLQYRSMQTHVSPYEIEAAHFLKEHYDESTMIVSDPATQYILETLSGINSQGGIYMNHRTRDALHRAWNAPSIGSSVQQFNSITDEIIPIPQKKILALSGRYFLWQGSSKKEKDDIAYNIWYAPDLNYDNKRALEIMRNNPRYFKIVYESPAVVLVEISYNI